MMGNARKYLHVDGRTEYSRFQGYALHLVGPARCGVLWAVKTEWNHHRGSVSNAIDAFQPNIEGETATVPRETRQCYTPAWQCSPTGRKTGQNIVGNAKMGGLTLPAVLSGRRSFRLPFFAINRTRPILSAFPLLWRSQEVDRFVDRFERHIIFSRWYLTIGRKMKKVVASDGQYFES